jgi:hypothetical protein
MGARLGHFVLIFAYDRSQLVSSSRPPPPCRHRFLFNVRTRQLMGVLQPIGPPGMNLEPAAWGARFPVQVRFRPLHTRVWPGRVRLPTAPLFAPCSKACSSATHESLA